MPKDSHSQSNSKTSSSYHLSSPEKRGRCIPESRSEDTTTGGLVSPGQISTTTTKTGSSPGTFFESSSNVQITGGHFTTSQGRHTNLTINFNQLGHEDSTGIFHSGSGNAPRYRDVDLTQQVHHILDNVSPLLPSLPARKSSEIYYRHLATKERGSPLWVPQPNNMLPVEYQTRGIDIGDVGIITDYGGFDFLFNICASATDPINPPEMPEDFSPLEPPLGSRDICGYSEYNSDSYIASSLVGTSQHDSETSGLIFETPASEGAILTMPNGSSSKDLGNLVRFRKYASANAEKWYKYVNEVRGREARNGDVRLVIGYDYTTAWGMATFANHTEHARSFRLKFKPISENTGLGRTYGWEYSGIADVKSGPDIREVQKLSELAQAGDYTVYENQCLFVRTLNITLQDEIWNRLAAECEMLYLNDEAQPANQHSQSLPGTSNQTVGPTEINLHNGSSAPSMKESSISLSRHKPSEAIQISNLIPALDIHPSKLINEFILREVNPNAKMAITEDENWIGVLSKSDHVLPSSETLFSRMKTMYNICEEEGVVFLHRNEEHFGSSGMEESSPRLIGSTEIHISNDSSQIVNSDATFHAPHPTLFSSVDSPKPADHEKDLMPKDLQTGQRTWSNVDAVQDRLFLGNITAARSQRVLTEKRITHILSVCVDPIPAELPESGITHRRINIEDVDYADLLIHLPASCHFIESALASGGAILVHDVQGISRSAAVVAAYLMYSRRINSTQALTVVKSARDQIWPNPGFQEQLVLFELCHYAPSQSNAIYVNWRTKLDRRLHAASLPSAADSTVSMS